MVKKALEYLVGLDKPNLVEVNGATFCDKNLERVVTDQYADCFRLTTLSSLVDYIKSNCENKLTVVGLSTCTNMCPFISSTFDLI